MAPENLPAEMASDFAAVSLYPLARIGKAVLDPSEVEGHIMAYRQWLPNPSSTIGVRMTDDAMHPILPAGSIVAIDRSIDRSDPAPRPDRGRLSRWKADDPLARGQRPPRDPPPQPPGP